LRNAGVSAPRATASGHRWTGTDRRHRMAANRPPSPFRLPRCAQSGAPPTATAQRAAAVPRLPARTDGSAASRREPGRLWSGAGVGVSGRVGRGTPGRRILRRASAGSGVGVLWAGWRGCYWSWSALVCRSAAGSGWMFLRAGCRRLLVVGSPVCGTAGCSPERVAAALLVVGSPVGGTAGCSPERVADLLLVESVGLLDGAVSGWVFSGPGCARRCRLPNPRLLDGCGAENGRAWARCLEARVTDSLPGTRGLIAEIVGIGVACGSLPAAYVAGSAVVWLGRGRALWIRACGRN
jgi:hypothetical protein